MREYVALAEAHNGPICKPVTGAYIWGEALSELARVVPDVRIINLETSVTESDDYWRGKGDRSPNRGPHAAGAAHTISSWRRFIGAATGATTCRASMSGSRTG
jgi:poly-gamma-glutamate capsule biosynthesis protein CapA/YwtB (metallophosphatase superfamily)